MQLENAIGAMIGAAYGDSLGSAVEFLSLDNIHEQYGPDGISRLDAYYDFGRGAITDDTQMAIATARGILTVLPHNRHIRSEVMQSIWSAYLGWLKSQDDPYFRRAPGNTCLSALRSGRMGSVMRRINCSSGCGAVMRAHPVGVAYHFDPRLAFEFGLHSGAITHGGPDGYVPAGAMAYLIARLLGDEKSTILDHVTDLEDEIGSLVSQREAAGTLKALRRIDSLSWSYEPEEAVEDVIGQTGSQPGGWQGHDALAIGVYAAIIGEQLEDPLAGVRLAVNHSGDSDSTGSIAGALLGARFGRKVFERELNRQGVLLESHELLVRLAVELAEGR